VRTFWKKRISCSCREWQDDTPSEQPVVYDSG